MLFRQIFEKETSTYTYLLAAREGAEAILIDPVHSKMDHYRRLLAELDLTLKYALDTHVHADHRTALDELRKETGCKTVMGKESVAECVSQTVKDGDVIEVEGISLWVIATPGHTDDSYSFVMNGRVFTGDTLLIRGTGRTDFQNGDAHIQYDSIFGKLLALPDETLVYPGHDYNGNTVSTIGEEKRFNPRLQVNSRAEYVELMNNLNLPSPRFMDTVVPQNQACGRAI